MSNKSWNDRRKAWENYGKKTSPNFKMKTNGVGKKVAYINVPAGTVTTPSDAHVIQRKYIYTKDAKSQNAHDTYVLCAGTKRSYTSKKTGKMVTIQNLYVGKIVYYGGYPGVMQFLYNGTSERDARHRFAQIPYNELYVAVTDNVSKLGNAQTIKTDASGQKWAIFTGNGKYSMIVNNQIRRKNYRQTRKFSQVFSK